ncbi:MAG: metallophosphoesterase [Clostridia bacterium]|nr:metallophosphoesterase [Clostridia bacterium]
MKKTGKKRSFTIVELVIVIAVIAILAAVLIPTFSTIISKADESKALQEARNAWQEISFTYAAGYRGFAADCGELNGWYYDEDDEIAKYDVDEKYTVTYNGEDFVVIAYSGSALTAKEWDAINDPTVDYHSLGLGDDPFALIITYYDNIYSRGFAWITATSNTETKLFLAESKAGKDADFSGAAITGTVTSGSGFNAHKVHVTGLKAQTNYSYKVGSDGHWQYGTFKTEKQDPAGITAVFLSDAQTKNPDKLVVWENTLAQAIETAGRGIDMVLFNGDQADANGGRNLSGEMTVFDIRYGVARETIGDYIGSVPYMASSGNHEATQQYTLSNNNDIDYGVDGVADDGFTAKGGYYSYDYGFAHFVVLDSNDKGNAQIEWLKADLAATTAKWKIVMMHNGPYSTGDNSNNSSSNTLTEKYAPVFSQYHVDLVLQAHDHTYSKTLPYKWDSVGYFNIKDASKNTANGHTASSIEDVVNMNPATTVLGGKTFDLNPNGTYYVTTGAAGHRVGASEADSGVWSETVKGSDGNAAPLLEGIGFLYNEYQTVVGKIGYSNTYTSFDASTTISQASTLGSSLKGTGDTFSYTSSQSYSAGDPASANVNAPMFGILELTEDTLIYSFYTAEGNTVKLFDTLNVMKTN